MSAYSVPFNVSTLGPKASSGGPSTYQWIFGWIVLIALLAFASQNAVGHTIIYYALVLILVFLLVTQYQFIAAALAPVGQPAPSKD